MLLVCSWETFWKTLIPIDTIKASCCRWRAHSLIDPILKECLTFKMEFTSHTFQLDPNIHQHDYSSPVLSNFYMLITFPFMNIYLLMNYFVHVKTHVYSILNQLSLMFMLSLWCSPFSVEFKVAIVISFQSELSKLHKKSDPKTPRLWVGAGPLLDLWFIYQSSLWTIIFILC